ncbi:hypothetical protein Y1Q_0016207 [Alligator mississippiensis]|uniref:Uncharacterized protein n=1 Tax=Alligator mississippiensis TaxID=8496 RepID=A0A151P1E2_ALLMI|nr:hypothetical protein Y1Q_0016207 [Alligator mississippiensis]
MSGGREIWGQVPKEAQLPAMSHGVPLRGSAPPPLSSALSGVKRNPEVKDAYPANPVIEQCHDLEVGDWVVYIVV